jgi:glycosyltransferase involved in cell wall biosynthesis
VKTAHDWPALLRDIPLLALTRHKARVRVVQFHGSNVHLLGEPRRILLRLATRVLAAEVDAILVLSQEEARIWRRFFPSTPVHVVRNVFVPPMAVDLPPEERREPECGKPPTVLYVGRILRAKGVFQVVDAVAALHGRMNLRARIVGSGRDLAALRSYVHQRGLAEVILLDGRLEGSALVAAYRQAALFAFPTSWPEGFPTVLLEAMWAGLPIVTTHTRGAADVLREGENALFVPPRDANVLATAIEKLIVDSKLARRMTLNNRALLRNFDASIVAEEYLAVLQHVLSPHGSAADTIDPHVHAKPGPRQVVEFRVRVPQAEPSGVARDAPRTPSADSLEASARAFFAWLQAYGPLSWDPYDLWATRLGRRIRRFYYRDGRFVGSALAAPLALIDAAFPEIRGIGFPRRRFPIGDAHYAQSFLNLYRKTGDEAWLPWARRFILSLQRSCAPGQEEYAWGNAFPWESRYGTFPASAPMITVTPYVYEAFEAAVDYAGWVEYEPVLESAARFVATAYPQSATAPGMSASSYSPADSSRVVNASAYRAMLLARAGTRFGMQDWLDKSTANVAFVLSAQTREGSWPYALDPGGSFIDNIHTCFVLKNLYKAYVKLCDPAILAAVCRGYAFYRTSLLDHDGHPRPFARAPRLTLYRRDLYDYAEGISLGLLLRDAVEGAEETARHLLREILESWQLPDGHFVTRRSRWRRNAVPYHRWAQAQTFYALTTAVAEGL